MNTLNHEQYSEQLKNLNLFLAGKKLEKSNLELYKFLYRKAQTNDSLVVKSTVDLIALSLGWDPDRTLTKLIELKRFNLFQKMELTEGVISLKIKDFQNYARLNN